MAKTATSQDQVLLARPSGPGGYFDVTSTFRWQVPSTNNSPSKHPAEFSRDTPNDVDWSPAEDPEGAYNAIRVTNRGASLLRMWQGGTVGMECVSAWVRSPRLRYFYWRPAGNSSYVWVDLEQATVVSSGSSQQVTVTEVGDGWVSIDIYEDYSPSGTSIMGVSDTSATINGAYVDGDYFEVFQLKAGPGPNPLPYERPGYAPRVDWREGKRSGILTEPNSTNLAEWSGIQAGVSPPSASSMIALSGVSYQDTFIGFPDHGALHFPDTGGASTSYAYKRMYNVADGQVSTFSVFVRMDDGSEPLVSSSVTGATSSLALLCNSRTSPDTKKEYIGNGIWRLWITVDAINAGSKNFGVLKYQGNAPGGFAVTGYQLENRPSMSSYIPTTSTPVSRSALSNLYMAGDLGRRVVSGEEGSVFLAIKDHPEQAPAYLLSITDGTTDERFIWYRVASDHSRVFASKGGVQQAYQSFPSTATGVRKAILSWGPEGLKACVEGTVYIASSAQKPLFKEIQLGGAFYNHSQPPVGTLKDFRVFPTQLSDEAMIALTS